jgi:hypothetical protein
VSFTPTATDYSARQAFPPVDNVTADQTSRHTCSGV